MTTRPLEALAEKLAEINPNWDYTNTGGGVMCIQRLDDDFQYLVSDCEFAEGRFGVGTYPKETEGRWAGEYTEVGATVEWEQTAEDVIAFAVKLDKGGE